MKKRYWILLIFLICITITYFVGPSSPNPLYGNTLPQLPNNFEELQENIARKEDSMPVRRDNEARIIFQQEPPQITEYSIVYLHGFSGSYRDGYPVNMQLADSLGANLYLARWAGHGLKPPAAMKTFSAEAAWNSAREALAIGKKIGKKVIILSTSTGGTLAIKLAAEFPESVFAIINMSPNLKDDQMGAFMLNTRWGYEIANLVTMGEKKIEYEEPQAAQYFDTIYPAEALVNLQVLVGSTMVPETFRKVTCPVLTLYYHENFWKEDEHVEIEIYSEVHKKFSTPDSLVKLQPLATPGTHFLGSAIRSNDTQVVLREILDFLQNKLEIPLRKKK
ncbi:alpha/beta hydrolase [Zunongwangia sp. H14]|uniref:alpha/beta hydrolase n=1 Tax=Zunongwangia sp. H14 TaxID=3240792 RepID=UPI0035614AA5